jgi:hypothetical protein
MIYMWMLKSFFVIDTIERNCNQAQRTVNCENFIECVICLM